jgi:hypothetical protein
MWTAISRLETLAGTSYRILCKQQPNSLHIFKTAQCQACQMFEEGETRRQLELEASRMGIPFKVHDCLQDTGSFDLLMSTGNSKVPCILYIKDGVPEMKLVDEFDAFLAEMQRI